MYFTGRGMPQDYVEAMKWFRLAANKLKEGDRIDFIFPLEDIEKEKSEIEVSFASMNINRIGRWQKGTRLTFKKTE